MKGNLDEAVKVVSALLPLSRSANTYTSAAIDTLGYDEALVILHAGATSSNGTVDVTLQEDAASGGSYAAITSAAFTQITTANDDAVYVGRLRLNKGARKRYLQVKAVVANQAAVLSATVLLKKGDGKLPETQAAAVAFNV